MSGILVVSVCGVCLCVCFGGQHVSELTPGAGRAEHFGRLYVSPNKKNVPDVIVHFFMIPFTNIDMLSPKHRHVLSLCFAGLELDLVKIGGSLGFFATLDFLEAWKPGFGSLGLAFFLCCLFTPGILLVGLSVGSISVGGHR